LRLKVLIVDFDGQQADLTHTLQVKPKKVLLSESLLNDQLNIEEAIPSSYITATKVAKKPITQKIFDIIPADNELYKYNQDENQAKIQKRNSRLEDLLKPLRDQYDYTILDSPTNWSFFSQSCI
jgi:cellulose biosynthesis protein BcsQ